MRSSVNDDAPTSGASCCCLVSGKGRRKLRIAQTARMRRLRVCSDGAYVDRLRAFLTLAELELDRLILLQISGAGVEAGNVDKDVRTILLRYESIAFLR